MNCSYPFASLFRSFCKFVKIYLKFLVNLVIQSIAKLFPVLDVFSVFFM